MGRMGKGECIAERVRREHPELQVVGVVAIASEEHLRALRRLPLDEPLYVGDDARRIISNIKEKPFFQEAFEHIHYQNRVSHRLAPSV